MSVSSIKLIVGLGNPGTEYVGTRHNVGFEVIDTLGQIFKQRQGFVNRCRSQVETVRWAKKNFWLMKPQTFMNLSGEAVKCLCRQEQINPEEILVVYDCLDLNVGRMRLRPSGSSGGQKGMESIITHLGTENVNRLRIGIGALEEGEKNTADFVLSPFPSREREVMDRTVLQAVEAVKSVILSGIEVAMTRHNSCRIEAKVQSQDL